MTLLSAQRIDELFTALDSGTRLGRVEGIALYEAAPLARLGAQAHLARQRQLPGNIASYLVDRNINYTNVCNSDCSFCGFYRHNPRDPEAYVLSREVIGRKIEETLELGGTRILLQGGHNDELSFDYYVGLISWIHENYPIEINSFSPSEIHQMHLVSDKSYEDILRVLKSAGMKGLPGGGAEILDDEIRKRVSPKKISAGLWLEIMEVAHELDLTTTATMVFGFGELIEHRINHFDRIRALQDRSLRRGFRGFNAFISWPLQVSEATSMGRSRFAPSYGAGPVEYLRNVAMGRLYIDNIVHHQASWPTLGGEIAEVGLHFGCDDIGSTMIEENVVSRAGARTKQKWSMSPEELRAHIRRAGFVPAQRNSSFEILETFSKEEGSPASVERSKESAPPERSVNLQRATYEVDVVRISSTLTSHVDIDDAPDRVR